MSCQKVSARVSQIFAGNSPLSPAIVATAVPHGKVDKVNVVLK